MVAVVVYASNVLGSRGPRKMRVAVPRVDPKTNDRAVFRPDEESESMINMFKSGHTQDMVCLINKPPKWSSVVGAYVLNFSGRVTMASVKNFQMVVRCSLYSSIPCSCSVLLFNLRPPAVISLHIRLPLNSLQEAENQDGAPILQFGRVGKDLFTMDFQWPLSPLQAFAVALSSFDYKLACE